MRGIYRAPSSETVTDAVALPLSLCMSQSVCELLLFTIKAPSLPETEPFQNKSSAHTLTGELPFGNQVKITIALEDKDNVHERDTYIFCFYSSLCVQIYIVSWRAKGWRRRDDWGETMEDGLKKLIIWPVLTVQVTQMKCVHCEVTFQTTPSLEIKSALFMASQKHYLDRAQWLLSICRAYGT